MGTELIANDSQRIDFLGVEWTGRKSDLVEILDVLYASKAFNNRASSLDELKKKD